MAMIAVDESTPFVVDTATPNAPAHQQATALADGRYVVIWQETTGQNGDASGSAVKAKILNADGSVSVAEFLVNTATVGDQVSPRVEALAGGGFVAMWTDNGASGARGQIYDAAGAKVGGQFAGSGAPNFATLTDGDFVLGLSGGVQRYHADGQPVGGATAWVTNAFGTGGQLVALQNGDFGHLYYDNTSGLYLQKYTSAGAADGAVKLADVSTNRFPNFSSISFAALDDGGYAVAFLEGYYGGLSVGNVQLIRLSKVAAGSNAITSSTLAEYHNQLPPTAVSLAVDGSQTFVGWTDPSGLHLTNTSYQNSAPPTSAVDVDVSMTSDGHYLVTWTDAAGAVHGQVFESLTTQDGTMGMDVLTGTSGSDFIQGFGGDDIIVGNGGTDYLYGGDGDDVIVAGAGASRLYGDVGHDLYFIVDSATQVIEGHDEGYDTINTSADYTLSDNVEALFLTGSALNGAGNALDNVLTGNGLNNILQGLDGDDSLFGDAGNDSLYGGTGADTLYGQTGDDLLYGWTGTDHIEGGSGNDTIYGEDDADTLYGEDGNDTLYAGTGDDFLAGQVGTDALWGEAGNDFLYGGENADQLAGQAGADVFYYKAMTEGGDTILDFNSAEGDRIIVDAAAFGAFSGFQLTAGLGFISGAGAAPTAATATFYYDTATQNLWYDVDGTGASQGVLIAHMANNPTLHASDFIFA